MVGLHVLHDDVVERLAREREGEIFKEQIAHGVVHRVDEGVLSALYKIGVVRNAARDGVSALKEGDAPVVPAEIVKSLCDLLTILHSVLPCFFRGTL